MKCARAELLMIALCLAPAVAAPDPAPDLELLEFLADGDEAQEIADAELESEPRERRPEPPRNSQPGSREREVPEGNDD